jgi:hypothetical protein
MAVGVRPSIILLSLRAVMQWIETMAIRTRIVKIKLRDEPFDIKS